MTFERITSPSHPLYADAMALYGISSVSYTHLTLPTTSRV